MSQAIWNLDWSPDSQKIVFERTTEEYSNGTIEVISVHSGAIAKVADGHSPAWSPSGEWVSYFDSNEKHVNLMHPDGSEQKNVARLKNEFWNAPLLWSADSKQLLINQWWNVEDGSFAIDILDIATMKQKRAFKKVPPVWGWAPAK